MRMISLCVKNAALGLGRFYLPLLYLRDNDPSLNAGALSDTATFRFDVLVVGMRIRALRGTNILLAF